MKIMAEHPPGAGEVEPRGLGADGDGEIGSQQLTGEAVKLLAPLGSHEASQTSKSLNRGFMCNCDAEALWLHH